MDYVGKAVLQKLHQAAPEGPVMVKPFPPPPSWGKRIEGRDGMQQEPLGATTGLRTLGTKETSQPVSTLCGRVAKCLEVDESAPPQPSERSPPLSPILSSCQATSPTLRHSPQGHCGQRRLLSFTWCST